MHQHAVQELFKIKASDLCHTEILDLNPHTVGLLA